MTQSQQSLLLAKSFLQAVIFLLRFQALRYCGAAAMILAEISGNVAARFFVGGKNRNFGNAHKFGSSKISGFVALFLGLLFLSVSWDRIECFPLSSVNISKFGISKNCVRVWPMLLPFLSGFLGCYERLSMNSGSIREMGQKRVRLVSLFYTTVWLFIPTVISMFVFEAEGDNISLSNFGWPLVNTVVFGVLLSENFTDERPNAASKDFQREYVVTYVCTLILELFYFPELSLWGLLVCGFLLWIAVRNLDPVYSNYLELELESSESLSAAVMKPLRHILSERKSRKIALFLLINTAYMVVEFVAGFMSNSLGLISDACHMLFDCAALAIGLYASYISRLPANVQFNYGRGRFEVLSGYVNAVFLVLVGALIVLESFERILDPQEISTNSLLAVSVGGLFVNIVGLIFFHEEHHHAHGGGGSCSPHSQSESHSHHVNDHHHTHDHGHPVHNHGEEYVTVVHDCHEKSCSTHDKQCHGDHEHHECSKEKHEHDNKGHGHSHHHDDDHSHHECHHDADQHVAVSHQHSNEKVILNSGEKGHHHHHHHHIDHNMEGIFLHVLADTMGSVGVVISTLLIKYKGWLVADPACSIFISVLIVSSVIPLLRNSAEILLQRVPRAHEHDLKEAISNVKKMKGVCDIQSLHAWSFTNTDVVGTLHLRVSTDTDKIATKNKVSDILHDAGIKDLTVQVECIKDS
nr:zinc transporter 5 [Ipomoea batatas]